MPGTTAAGRSRRAPAGGRPPGGAPAACGPRQALPQRCRYRGLTATGCSPWLTRRGWPGRAGRPSPPARAGTDAAGRCLDRTAGTRSPGRPAAGRSAAGRSAAGRTARTGSADRPGRGWAGGFRCPGRPVAGRTARAGPAGRGRRPACVAAAIRCPGRARCRAPPGAHRCVPRAPGRRVRCRAGPSRRCRATAPRPCPEPVADGTQLPPHCPSPQEPGRLAARHPHLNAGAGRPADPDSPWRERISSAGFAWRGQAFLLARAPGYPSRGWLPLPGVFTRIPRWSRSGRTCPAGLAAMHRQGDRGGHGGRIACFALPSPARAGILTRRP